MSGELIISDNANSLRSQFMPVFEIADAIQRRNVIVAFTQQLMVKDHDFGVIPGTNKPTLLKPGAEKLCTLFGLTSKMTLRQSVEDWTGKDHGDEPFFYYVYSCALYRGDFLVAETEASANSWEKKYRTVNAGRKCPACGSTSIMKSKEEWGGGYYCNAKNGGCAAKFPKGDKSIEGQEMGSKPNPHSADLVNTLQKMSQKRALIGTCLIAVNASEFYTQDIEDMPQYQDTQEAPPAPVQQPPPPPRRPAASTVNRIQPQEPGTEAGEVLEDHAPMDELLDVPHGYSPSVNDDPMMRRTAPITGKCPSCNAPAGKAHTRTCTATRETANV